MYDTARDLIDAFQATPAVLEALVRGTTQEQARAARGGDEGWSVIEVICHLRDAEEFGLARTEAMRDQDDPFLAGYDQEQLARERTYAAATLTDALAAFSRLRARHIAALEALPAAGWDRPGRHEERGGITIGNHILSLVSHDAVHAAQIARQLQR